MNFERLDTTALQSALESYTSMINYALVVENKLPMERIHYELESAKASLIQHFEFSYDLCWKFMKRYLESEGMTFGYSRKDLFRTSLEIALIKDFDLWVDYHEARNRTSHTYDKFTAEEVYVISKSFFHEFNAFVHELEERL